MTDAAETKPFVIAIDGPAAAGKGTLARKLAQHFGFAYLDTGLIYRAVGLSMLRQGLSFEAHDAAAHIAQALDLTMLDDPEIRSEAAGSAASKVAVIGQVRDALLQLQQRFAAAPPEGAPGAVIDGRDIGTVICPTADIKLYVTASPSARAERRHAELSQKGQDVSLHTIRAEIEDRDRRDAGRATAPLVRADDAHLLDTTNSDIETVFKSALRLVDTALSHRPRR